MDNPRDKLLQLEFYEISNDEGVQESGSFNVDNVESESPGQVPLGAIQQSHSDKETLRYLDNYCSLVETMENLDPLSCSKAVHGHDTKNWLDAMREEI